MTPSSGNVFTDIGLPNSEEELAKADLTIEISRVIKLRQMTPAQVSQRLHIDESDALAKAQPALTSSSQQPICA